MSAESEKQCLAEEAKVDDASVPQSRIPQIWAHFNAQLDRIDELEKGLNEHANRARRRIAGVLDQTPPHRRSHLRMFVTHKYDKILSKWTLVVEGKLLIGLLDHRSAAMVERDGALSKGRLTRKESQGTSKPMPISDILPTATTNPDFAAELQARASDRNQYRSVGEQEENPVEPVLFTHFFEKLGVTFQTIYQPNTPPKAAASLTPPKKSRKRKAEKQELPAAVNVKHLKASESTRIVWKKNNSPDSHAFLVNYVNNEKERAPPPGMKFHSVVATITLHSTRPDPLYKPSSVLADKFFPKHRELLQTRGGESAAKRKKGDTNTETEDLAIPIAVDNDIKVPSFLTMQEIIIAISQYILDKKLLDANDKSLVVCDKVLSGLFECESLNFSDLQQTLLTKNLAIPVGPEEDPIVLKYIMTKNTTSPQVPPGTTKPEEVFEGDSHHHQVLSFDMDVAVPNLFHYRSREIMRRIKRREFEYTSSRTKARYLLVASRGNEDLVKNKIEQAVSGQGFAVENIPVFLALAKAAPPNSEARGAAQIDAKTCALVGRLDESSRKAEAAWDIVEACRELTSKK